MNFALLLSQVLLKCEPRLARRYDRKLSLEKIKLQKELAVTVDLPDQAALKRTLQEPISATVSSFVAEDALRAEQMVGCQYFEVLTGILRHLPTSPRHPHVYSYIRHYDIMSEMMY